MADETHTHRWTPLMHEDGCHYFRNTFACACGAVRHQTGERSDWDLLLWMREDRPCERCNELKRGAEPKFTDQITELEKI